MKKKQRTKKPNRVESILYSSGNNLLKVRKRIFQELTAKEIQGVIPRLLKSHHFKEVVTLHPEHFSKKSYDVSGFTKTPLDKSIHTILGVIGINLEKIKKLSQHEKNITRYILLNDYESAHKLLDASIKDFGISLWYVFLKSSILDIENKAEEKNEIIIKILKNNKNAYVRYLIKNSTNRIDDSGFFNESMSSYKHSLSAFNYRCGPHIYYRMTPYDVNYCYDYTTIFNHEKNASVIDSFKCLMDYLIDSIYNTTPLQEHHLLAKKICDTLSDKIDHPVINSLKLFHSPQTLIYTNPIHLSVIDMYAGGEYQKLVNSLDTYKDELIHFNIFKYYVKSAVICGEHFEENTLLGKIANKLKDIFIKNENYKKSIDYLESISFAFYELPWFKELHLLVQREKSDVQHQDKYTDPSHLLSEVNGPLKEKLISHENKTLYNLLMREMTSSTKYLKQAYANCNFISDKVIVFSKNNPKQLALSKIDDGDIKAAISYLEVEFSKHDTLTNNELSKILSDAYISNGNINEAIEFCAKLCIQNPHSVYLFNTDRMCELIQKHKAHLQCIYTPILISFHQRYKNKKYITLQRFSLESFLVKNGMTSAQDFVKEIHNYEIKEALYFLENVFTTENMKLNLLFGGTKIIENNRIYIANYLLSLDQKNERVTEELKEIAKSQVLKKATQQIENSKIYADTAKLKSTTASIYSEQFEKYTGLLALFIEILNKKELGLIWVNKDKNINTDEITHFFAKQQQLKQDKVAQMQSERYMAFERLISQIRDEFVFGINGLNSNLSTRIRHGHFPNTFRRSLVTERLLIAQASQPSSIKSNDYWNSKLKVSDESEYELLDEIFYNFHKEFEGLINEVNDKWLQVKITSSELDEFTDDDGNKEQAMFDFTITDAEYDELIQFVKTDTSYHDFIRHVIDWLWSKTDTALNNVRCKINSELRDNATKIIKNLQTEVNKLVHDDASLNSFNDSISRAREALSINIDTIVSWFKKSEVTQIEDYDFDTVIEITEKAVALRVNKDVGLNIKLQGRTLTYFVDILYIFLENAVSKSNLTRDDLLVEVRLHNIGADKYMLSISNNCLPIENLQTKNSELALYQEQLNSATNYLDGAQKEGKSGYKKVTKILKEEMKMKFSLSFQYEMKDRFTTALTFYNFDKVLTQ
ncbi:hypothetical protein ACET97_04545 [Aeromonas enteropelogenes]|uniref:hypothetical protein n=1 Tax=Aeromonas enteropelogenes TaxID=29489 RepID=UPI0038CFCB00